MSLFTSNSGKSIVRPDQIGPLVIQPLMATSVAMQIAQVIQIENNSLRIPVVQQDPQASWTAEGAEINVSDANLSEVNIKPAKLAALTLISSELAADSSPAALEVVGQGIVRELARAIDAAYFAPTPANAEAPQGIAALAGVSEVVVGDGTLNAAVPTIEGASSESFDWALVADSYARLCNTTLTAIVVSPARFAFLSFIKDSNISNRGLLQPDPVSPTRLAINGVPLYVSPAVQDDVVWCIPRAHAFIALRQDTSVVADTSVAFTSDRVAVRATTRLGFGFTYPEAIVRVRFDKPILTP